MKKVLKFITNVILVTVISVTIILILQTNNILLGNNQQVNAQYDTITYVFDLLEYNTGGLFGEERIIVSNDQISSTFTIYQTGNLATLDLDWFEYDDDLAITFKKSVDDKYDKFIIQNISYNVYSLTDTYIYRDEVLTEYFYCDYVEQPTIQEQEIFIEELYETDYDLIFTDFAEYGEDNGVMGEYSLFDNTISILEDLPVFMFSTTYAHELEHSRGTLNEKLTQFKSFTKLWESEIPYLKYQVWLEVQYTIDDFYGWDYDCTIMLFDYIQEQN